MKGGHLKNFIKRYFANGSSSRHVAMLVSGTILGQLSTVLASPFLTRLYSPKDFGTLAVYVAIVSILAVISNLRYELAIPLPRLTTSSANIFILSIFSVASISLILTIFIFVFYEQIPSWLNLPSVASFIYILPLGLFFTGLYQAINYWAVRQKMFYWIAQATMLQSILTVFVQLVLGWKSHTEIGLIIGQIFGQCLALLVLFRKVYVLDKAKLRFVSCLRIRVLAKRYQQFPLLTTWQGLANTGSTMLPLILFASLLSPEICGYYMLAQRMLSMPLSLVGRSIGQVFHSRAAESYHNGTLRKLTINVYKRLLRFSVGPIIFAGIIAPKFFGIIFGDQWNQSGIYAQWMVPWLITQFIVSPLSVIASVTRHQFGDLISQLLFLIIRISAIFFGIYQLNQEYAVYFYAATGFITYFGYWLWLTKLVNISLSIWTRIVLKELIITLPLILLGEIICVLI